MNKILISVLFASALGFANAATEIATPAAFKAALETDPAGDYLLTADIDLTSSGYASIASFSGSLDGAGHTISGLGAQALFQSCSGAVTNLTIDGTVGGANTERTQTGCGVFADKAAGATFVGCLVKGYTLKHATTKQLNVGNGLVVGTTDDGCSFERCLAETGCILDLNSSSQNNQGGLVGIVLLKNNGSQCTFLSCTNRAQISSTVGGAFAGLGGIAGALKRSQSGKGVLPVAIFRDCVNETAITVSAGDSSQTSNVGGMVGYVAGYGIDDPLRVDFENCINNGNLANSHSAAVGGVVGQSYNRAYVRFDSCVNRGILGGYRVKNAGGLLGYAERCPNEDSVAFVNCANYGKVAAQLILGGLFGYGYGNTFTVGTCTICNSANYGELVGESGSVTGEIVGKINNGTTGTMAVTVTIDNCWRKGDLNACGSLDSACTLTETHGQTAATSAATAVANLNAVARESSDYVQWAVGDNDYPELYVEGALGPEPQPVAVLSEATAALARDGQSVTCSVEVASVTVEGGVLRLVVNGQTVKSWTLAAGKQEHVMSVMLGKTYAYSFVAEEATPSPYTTVTVEGTTFTAIGEADWFDVKFDDAGYVPGATWMTDSTDKSGGTWSGVAGETELDAATRTVSFVTTPTAPVYYAPKSSSKARAGVVINGKMLVDESASVPPADVPFAVGFEFDTTAMAFKPVVYTNGVKTAFGTASLGWKSMAGFTIEGKPVTDDCLTWRLQVTIGSMVSDELTVTVPKRRVSSLGYSGGSFGDLRGVSTLIREANGLMMLLR